MLVERCNILNPYMLHCDMMVIEKGPVFAAVGFANTVFDRCKFYNVTLYIDPGTAQAIAADCQKHGQPTPLFLGAWPPKPPQGP